MEPYFRAATSITFIAYAVPVVVPLTLVALPVGWSVADVDLYTISIWGMDALGSVGFGLEHTQEIYRAGDSLPAIMALNSQAQPSAADPFAEINTLAWKAWHAGAVLNSNWCRAVRVGATDLTA